jgi:hypothetical protein
MTFVDFLNAVHRRYQENGAFIPFSECFVRELKLHRPELLPKQPTNRRVRVTEKDFLSIRDAW